MPHEMMSRRLVRSSWVLRRLGPAGKWPPVPPWAKSPWQLKQPPRFFQTSRPCATESADGVSGGRGGRPDSSAAAVAGADADAADDDASWAMAGAAASAATSANAAKARRGKAMTAEAPVSLFI